MNSTMFSSRKGPPEVLIDAWSRWAVHDGFHTFDLVVELVQNELDVFEKDDDYLWPRSSLCEGK